MSQKITYWLDWEQKLIKSNTQGLNDIPWAEVENYPLTIYCSAQDWPRLEIEEKNKVLITNEQKRTYQVGKATIKELRGADEQHREGMGSQALKLLHQLVPEFVENHPCTDQEFFKRSNYWKFAPRFENLQTGTFTQVTKIDIKSCYGRIMQDYPLPCGKPELITDSVEIEKKLKAGKEGFVSFYCRQKAIIKKHQIPFLPNDQSEVKDIISGGWLLYTKLLKTFQRQYGQKGKLIYKNFWIFAHQKGCLAKFLSHCQTIKQTEPKRGKMLVNALYGVLGKNKFSGYHYHPLHLAVNHLAILQTYYLYRQFAKEQVLAIRSDCIYVQGELPLSLLKRMHLYHITKYQQVTFQGEENVFLHDTQELKARQAQGSARKAIIKSLLDN